MSHAERRNSRGRASDSRERVEQRWVEVPLALFDHDLGRGLVRERKSQPQVSLSVVVPLLRNLGGGSGSKRRALAGDARRAGSLAAPVESAPDTSVSNLITP